MNRFVLNGRSWYVNFVDPHDPVLVDRTGRLTVATTDPNTNCIYISNVIHGEFFYHVLIHEIGHCALVSFDLLDDIHRFVYPEYWIEAEEWVCNFIADYGESIFNALRSVIGQNAMYYVPIEIERIIA